MNIFDLTGGLFDLANKRGGFSLAPAVPSPKMLTQPTGVTVTAPDQFSLSATVDSTTGKLPYSWRWQKDNTDIPGATGSGLDATYLVTNSAVSNGGGYTVIYTDADGKFITSNVATVTVKPPLVDLATSTVHLYVTYRNATNTRLKAAETATDTGVIVVTANDATNLQFTSSAGVTLDATDPANLKVTSNTAGTVTITYDLGRVTGKTKTIDVTGIEAAFGLPHVDHITQGTPVTWSAYPKNSTMKLIRTEVETATALSMVITPPDSLNVVATGLAVGGSNTWVTASWDDPVSGLTIYADVFIYVTVDAAPLVITTVDPGGLKLTDTIKIEWSGGVPPYEVKFAPNNHGNSYTNILINSQDVVLDNAAGTLPPSTYGLSVTDSAGDSKTLSLVVAQRPTSDIRANIVGDDDPRFLWLSPHDLSLSKYNTQAGQSAAYASDMFKVTSGPNAGTDNMSEFNMTSSNPTILEPRMDSSGVWTFITPDITHLGTITITATNKLDINKTASFVLNVIQ